MGGKDLRPAYICEKNIHVIPHVIRGTQDIVFCVDGGLRQVLAAVGEDFEEENSASRTAWSDALRGARC